MGLKMEHVRTQTFFMRHANLYKTPANIDKYFFSQKNVNSKNLKLIVSSPMELFPKTDGPTK